MEKTSDNRVTAGLNDWLEKEQQMKQIFGNDVVGEKHIARSKRDFFNDLHKTCKPDASKEEKLLLNVIEGETRKIERFLHPNPVIRVLMKLSDAVKEKINAFKEKQATVSKDLLTLKKNIPAADTSKEHRNPSLEVTANVQKTPQEQLQQYKNQTNKINDSKHADKTIDAEKNSLLPKKRINNSHGHSIY